MKTQEERITQVYNTTPNGLINALYEKIDDRFSEFEKRQELNNNSDRLLTRVETAKYLSVSLVCLHNWKIKAILVPVKIGKVVRYRMKDIIQVLNKR